MVSENKILSGKILIVDDEPDNVALLTQTLKGVGYSHLRSTMDPREVSAIYEEFIPDLILLDLNMPHMDGFQVMKKLKKIDPNSSALILILTAYQEYETRMKALESGAQEFLTKPIDLAELICRIQIMLEVKKLRSELSAAEKDKFPVLGKSPSIIHLKQTIHTVVNCDADVLLFGETGTGKDLVAGCLHDLSERKNKKFVAINCGALPENIIESELFGHESGAFTGANTRRIGKFEYANGGTVFLDEIESMPIDLQVKILRVIQERKIERLGSNESLPIDVRIIAATKVDLKDASDKGLFRQDLYYRLNVVQILLPPLRERKEDISLLFQHFVLQASSKHNLPTPSLSQELMNQLTNERWDGNIRELKNEAEKYVLGLGLGLLNNTVNDKNSSSMDASVDTALTLTEQMKAFEKKIIEQELLRQGGSIKNSHAALGIPRQTLVDKMKKYGFEKKNFRA
ncbi:MAG: sigma-54-dependent Fis family transcriptional regulator [Nitrospinae bacterium]|nr:sigma-54-dependent Fis family transcriptional regulator [Nitrospinota bacterium]